MSTSRFAVLHRTVQGRGGWRLRRFRPVRVLGKRHRAGQGEVSRTPMWWSDEPGNFDPRVALVKIQNALLAHPDITVVLSSWDDMTRGVEQAIEAAGKKPGTDIRIYSIGATKDGVDKVKAGVYTTRRRCCSPGRSPITPPSRLIAALGRRAGERLCQRGGTACGYRRARHDHHHEGKRGHDELAELLIGPRVYKEGVMAGERDETEFFDRLPFSQIERDVEGAPHWRLRRGRPMRRRKGASAGPFRPPFVVRARLSKSFPGCTRAQGRGFRAS